MEIQKTAAGDRLMLKVTGRLETATAPQFDAEVKAISGDVKNLSVDFGGLEYVSSAGLRSILLAQKMMNARQGKMELSGVNQTVRHVFDITGFSSVLTFV